MTSASAKLFRQLTRAVFAAHSSVLRHGDRANAPFGQPDEFRGQTRDLYVSTGDAGFWQAAIRDPEDPLYAGLRETIEQRHPLLIDILYTNDEGDQRAITRFVVVPPEDEGSQWFCSVGRHMYLDRPNPR